MCVDGKEKRAPHFWEDMLLFFNVIFSYASSKALWMGVMSACC